MPTRLGVILALLLALGSVIEAAEPAEQPQPGYDLILHAGGIVRLEIPEAWHVSEQPREREVRLAIQPRKVPGRDRMWITVHARDGQPLEMPDLLSMIKRRLVEPAQRVGPPTPCKVNGGSGWKQKFMNTAGGRGFHTVLQCDAGLCEINAEAGTPHGLVPFTRIADGIRLAAPLPLPANLSSSVTSAKAALGSWKAFRGRVRLRPDGRITIVPDRKRGRSVGPTPTGQRPRASLEGTFTARDDLLFVQWADGSLLNLRWRRSGGYLLLTDHEGQISQLRRIYE